MVITICLETLVVLDNKRHFFMFKSVAVCWEVKISDCWSEGILSSKVIDRLLRMQRFEGSAVMWCVLDFIRKL